MHYPGHDLVNARFRYKVNERWQFAVRVNNVTDKDYAERADFAFGDDRYFVGEPFSVYVSVNVEFGK